MTTIWNIPTVVVAVLAWLSSASTSFVDVSRKEAARRQLIGQAVGAYSNDTLPRLRPSDAVGAPASAFTMTQVAQAIAPKESDGDVTPAAIGGAGQTKEKEGTEGWWRERMMTLRSTVARDQLLADGLQSDVARLQRDVTSRDDPAQRAVLAERLTQAITDLNRTRAKIQASRAEMDKVREDARVQGVPPGWIR